MTENKLAVTQLGTVTGPGYGESPVTRLQTVISYQIFDHGLWASGEVKIPFEDMSFSSAEKYLLQTLFTGL